ncbi:hypothetical protein [Ruegeria sp.]|uniref:phage tail tube protein n=1 Tax=Ruegeria sp. TaxID=1879320 RepID=UPI003B5B4F7D
MANLVTQHEPIVIFGAGAFFIDRHVGGKPSGTERFIGDVIAGSVSATVQRQTVYSGNGAVATKLVDKITQIDRSLGLTPQDATLDNMALFLMARNPQKIAEVAEKSLATSWPVPDTVTSRDYFQFGTAKNDLVGPAKITLGNSAKLIFAPALDAEDYAFDISTGRLRLTDSGIAKAKGKTLKLTIDKVKTEEFERVEVTADLKPIRVALRYIEDADEGVEGRNIYIPRATVAPSGDATLLGRNTPQQFPLTLSIEDPGDGLAQMYIDGVPT